MERILYTFYYDSTVLLQAESQHGIAETREGTPNNGISGAGEDVNGNDDGDGIDADNKPEVWAVWVFCQRGIPTNAIPSLKESGFMITVLDDNGTDITDCVMDVIIVRKNGVDALQFFVPTPGQQITVWCVDSSQRII